MINTPQYVLSPQPSSWLGRLWQKVWPQSESTEYKTVRLVGFGIVLIAVVTAGLIIVFRMHDHPATPVVKAPPSSTPKQSTPGTTTVAPPAPSTDKKPTATPPKAKSPAEGSGSTGGETSAGGGSEGGGSPPPVPCALPKYPDASCTGVPAGTTLQAVSGDVHITVAGTVLENKDISGCVFIEAPNVTVRKTKITCGFAFAVHTLASDYTGGGLLLQDDEITCGNTSATGVAGYGFTAQRVNVYGCENGFSVDNDAVIKDSYIHGLFHDVGAHTDGIQMGGGDNITIRHNRIFNDDSSGTSAIIGDTGSFSNMLITENLLAGGGYALYCAISPGANYVVTNNHFSRAIYANGGFYAPWIHCDNATQTTGNVWDDTDQPVAF